jgi:predicted amidohydrolase
MTTEDQNIQNDLEEKVQLRVAVVQPELLFDESKSPRENDEANVKHALELLERIDTNSVDLVIFPEVYPNIAGEVPMKDSGLLEAAKKIGTYVLAGETYQGRNASTLINPDGEVEKRMYKVQLSVEEIGHVKPGKQPGLFDIKVKDKTVKLGVLTCWDFAFPQQVEYLIKKGAKAIINPSMNVVSLIDARKSDARLWSVYFNIPTVSANLAGKTKLPWGMTYGGGNSEIISGTNTNIMELDRPAKDSDYVIQKLGTKEGILKHTLEL